jgi:transcriptional antiterminator NusG
MMMHENFSGDPVGLSYGDKFEDRMRRISSEHLRAASLPASPDSPWYALSVGSGYERTVENLLKDASVEAIVPLRKGREIRRRGRIIPARMLPVMTSYVLVRCMESNEAWAGLLGVMHVRGILGGYLKPHPITNDTVNRFNRMATTGKCDWERPVTVFRQGQRVAVTEGPFASFEGKVISCRNDGRGDAVVEMAMFGSVTPALIPLAILRAA